MNFYEVKSRVKNIPFIGETYAKWIGNRKIQKIEEAKRRALRENGLKTVEEIEASLESCGVKYFLDFGSLLGMIREQKFMEHDNDIDYGIYIDNSFSWDMLEDILVRQGMKQVKQYRYKGLIMEQTYKNRDLSVDFFLHWREGGYDNTYVFFKKKGFTYKSPNDYHVSQLKMYDFKHIKSVSISDISFNIPCEPEKYLASVYTEQWRIPDPNWVSEKGPAWNELSGEFAQREIYE